MTILKNIREASGRFWRELKAFLCQPSPWVETMSEHDFPDEQDGYGTDAAGTYDGR